MKNGRSHGQGNGQKAKAVSPLFTVFWQGFHRVRGAVLLTVLLCLLLRSVDPHSDTSYVAVLFFWTCS